MNAVEFLRPDGWLGHSDGPRYTQLRRRLEEGIANGVLAPNTSLPPERKIAEITDLSRVTVRKAIQALVRDGSIEQRQGSGTYIRKPAERFEQSLSRLTSFTEEMADRGLETASKWLERGIFLATPEEVATLKLAKGDEVARLCRLRLAGGRPVALERAALPLDILPNPTAVATSLYDLLTISGKRPVRAVQRISAINLGDADATLLGVGKGKAGLHIQRLSYLADGRIVEFTRSVFRGDAYEFVAELRPGA